MTPVEQRAHLEAEQRATNPRAIVAMVVAMASFAAGDTLVKIAGRELPIGELMVVRGCFASVFILTLAWMSGSLRLIRSVLRSGEWPWLLLRTGSEIGATICFFNGLMRLPFAECSAIAQFVPLAITAGGAVFFGEPVGWRRWLATIVGFIGVLVIVKPGTAAFDWAALWIFGSVIFVATRDLTTRRMGPGVPTLIIIALSAVAVTLSGFLLLPFETWVVPSTGAIVLLAGAAMAVLSGYYGVVVAMRSGEIATVAPFRYVVIVFAVLSSILVFGDWPVLSTYIGIGIVMGAGLYTLHRERVRRREARQPAIK